MPVKKSKTYELDIIDLAFGGKGLAKPEGFPVFVDRCVPGDRVFVKIFKKRNPGLKHGLLILLPPRPCAGRLGANTTGFAGAASGSSCPMNSSLNTKNVMLSSHWRISAA